MLSRPAGDARGPRTIYQALYVPGRGELRRELTRALRTGRAMRKPTAQADRRQHRAVKDMVNIAERPAEAAGALIGLLLKWIRKIADDAPVTWAIEDGRGFARSLADGLLLAGHEVVWVPTQLMAAHRKLHAATGSKSDPVDAAAVAHAAIATPGLDPAAYSARSWAAWAFLVVFGSVVALSAYVWPRRCHWWPPTPMSTPRWRSSWAGWCWPRR